MDSKIQIITYPPINQESFGEIKLSFFDRYDSLDSYKFNVIDLSNSKLWRYNKNNAAFMDDSNILTLINSISDVVDSIIIIILPKNMKFNIYQHGRYSHDSWLKNESDIVSQFLNLYFDLDSMALVYGKNKTYIDNRKFNAEFYIKLDNSGYDIITRNDDNKITSVQRNNFIYTTLQLTNRIDVIKFINDCILFDDEWTVPKWFDEIEMFDDKFQKQRIISNNNEIKRLKEDNNNAEEILKNNNEFKSILYKQSKPLVKVVFKILEDMLDYDLSDFKDNFKEDFLIKFDDVTFIGEIKGVGSNAKRKHLAQTDDHVSEREDLLEEEGNTENIKPLLIINRFIEVPPSERPKVDESTIKKAKEKYGILIITSEELLKLYESYLVGEISSHYIIERFKNEIGLFKL